MKATFHQTTETLTFEKTAQTTLPSESPEFKLSVNDSADSIQQEVQTPSQPTRQDSSTRYFVPRQNVDTQPCGHFLLLCVIQVGVASVDDQSEDEESVLGCQGIHAFQGLYKPENVARHKLAHFMVRSALDWVAHFHSGKLIEMRRQCGRIGGNKLKNKCEQESFIDPLFSNIFYCVKSADNRGAFSCSVVR